MSEKTFIELDRSRELLFNFRNTCLFEKMSGQSYLLFIQNVLSGRTPSFSDIADLIYCSLHSTKGMCDLTKDKFFELMNDYTEKNSAIKATQIVADAVSKSTFTKKMLEDAAQEMDSDEKK